MKLGEIEAALRDLNKLSLEDVASLVSAARGKKVAWQSIQQLEQNPDMVPRYVRHLGAAFGMSTDELYAWRPGMPHHGNMLASETVTNETVSNHEDTAAHNPVRAIRRVRIMGVVKMDSDGYWSSAEAEQGHLRYPTMDPDAYALRIDGDALHPAIRFGWYALVEPNTPPKARDFVLVEAESRRQTIMELISNDSGLRMLHAVNSDKRLTLQPGDKRICMRVSSLLTPATPVEDS